MIPYSRQTIHDEDIEAVLDVLKSDFLTQGPVVPCFEDAVAKKIGVNHATAVNSATSALHIACLALGLSRGDVLWTSPITYVASANCGLYCGAEVDFVDIDKDTLNICTLKLEKKLIAADKLGKLPKILVVVHMAGQSCKMDEIGRLSRKYGFKVIEDASHALGGKFKGNYIGSCQYSEITVFSLHPIKSITAGEGGLALTNSDELAEKLRMVRSHGITRDPNAINRKDPEPWYYEQIELGFNYRMTDIHAALGLSQLGRLEEYVARRNQIANKYDEVLVDLPFKLPRVETDCLSSFHLYIIQVNEIEAGLSRRQLFECLRARGIGVNVHYIPVHTQPYFQKLGFHEGDFPVSETYYSKAISLPIFPSLADPQQDYIVTTLEELTNRKLEKFYD